MIQLPPTPDAFTSASWGDILPYYEALATVPVTDASAEAWLADWSRLEELVAEAGTQAMIAYTCDTANAEKEALYLRFASEVFPQADAMQVRLARRLLSLNVARPDLAPVLEEFRSDVRIFREENVALHAELEELEARYQKVTGALSVEWDGEQKTIPQLQPYAQDPDRTIRERAFRAGANAYLAQRGEFAEIFNRMYALRQQVAQNAGFPDYMRYTFAAKHRFDYTPEDCERFHRAVEETVVPVVARLREWRRARLQVEALRPWDLAVDPEGHPALRPFRDTPEFLKVAERVFTAVDPSLGDRFREMEREGLLDLESRPGKAPGGYCTKLPAKRLPFIFMNAVGVADDVNTLVHEAGHCFHAFDAGHHPFIWQRGTGSEAAELASMSMELLAAPHLMAPTGYYTPDEARRAWMEHLEDVLVLLPHIACVDAFQQWIYTSGQGHDAEARDAAWLAIRARFERGIDWSDLERERISRWYGQLHIFEHPFYYIEYGIAQMGALQVWQQALVSPQAAVTKYREALALGGTARLPDIYAAAGAQLVFDADTMRGLVTLVEERLLELRVAVPTTPVRGVAAVAGR